MNQSLQRKIQKFKILKEMKNVTPNEKIKESQQQFIQL
jgi:hypothetical protein